MRPFAEFSAQPFKVMFTDIDGTLTQDGRLPASSYTALWTLHGMGIHVVPVTGRPAGWCDLIARFWPVHGVIGENGGLAYRYDGQRMHRFEQISRAERMQFRGALKKIAKEVRQKIPGARIAADQFCRRFDLAIDFAEDVRALPQKEVQKIKKIFLKHGAHAKVSNIHVNGWFGDYDKLSACKRYCREWLGWDLADHLEDVAFVGDSPNDESMFEFFKWSFAVANVKEFLPQMKHHPRFVTERREADGFLELTMRLIRS
jgi:HAD superfamily hydrolase (TIGR01484 family)